MKKKIIVLIIMLTMLFMMLFSTYGIVTVRGISGIEVMYDAAAYYTPNDEIRILLKGIDNNLKECTLNADTVSVKVDGVVVSPTIKQVTSSTTSSTEMVMLVTLSGFTKEGRISLDIAGETLEDLNGHKNPAKTITTNSYIEFPTLASQITPKNYGDTVNYSANGVSDWKIFLKEDDYVYIISSEVVPNSGYSGMTNVGTYRVYGVEYGGTYDQSRTQRDAFINWMKTSSNWSAYANGTSNGIPLGAGLATGGPTREQFWESYNAKNNVAYLKESLSGLDNTDTLYFPTSIASNAGIDGEKLEGSWLASS